MATRGERSRRRGDFLKVELFFAGDESGFFGTPNQSLPLDHLKVVVGEVVKLLFHLMRGKEDAEVFVVKTQSHTRLTRAHAHTHMYTHTQTHTQKHPNIQTYTPAIFWNFSSSRWSPVVDQSCWLFVADEIDFLR